MRRICTVVVRYLPSPVFPGAGWGKQKQGTKAVFGLTEPTRFQLALTGTVLGRMFNKRFLGKIRV